MTLSSKLYQEGCVETLYADLNGADLGAYGVFVLGHADCELCNNCYRKWGHVEQMPRIPFIEDGH